jgi:hypothetical protein
MSPSDVRSLLDTFEKTPANSTLTLLDALRALEAFGFSREEAVQMGFGRFPVGGEAYFRDDFGEPRSGPPPHPHAGNDIFAEFDTPVRAPADGTVRYEDAGLGGKAAIVTEPDGTYYYMAHLSGFAPGVASGDKVRTGQVVGFNGDSGNARGGAPHVHFEIHPGGGAAVNPKPTLDRWLEEALAAVPTLVAPFQHSITRPSNAVGLSRHFDQGSLLESPPRSDAPAGTDATGGGGAVASQFTADALVAPLTPPILRFADESPLPY